MSLTISLSCSKKQGYDTGFLYAGGEQHLHPHKQVGGWAIGIFLFGLLVPGINNWAHGGGILAGAALGALLVYGERVRENLFHRVLGIGCMLITAAVLIWAQISGILLQNFSLRSK
jgi:rhomboid protease GluP